MQKIDIEGKNIQFKQIITGPAPVGRILNYVKLSGKGILKHVNGRRTTNLENNVGYAWTTEYLIGLGLVVVGEKADIGHYLNLTENGRKIYEIIKDIPFDFSENINDLQKQIKNNCPQLLTIFEEVFRDSVVFKILRNYLIENGYEYIKNEFLNNYFKDIQEIYDKPNHKIWMKETRSTTVTTGGNRVPSLIQLCQFFNYVICKNGKLFFIKEQFEKQLAKTEKTIKHDKETLIKETKRESNMIKDLENIEEKYGIDGTTIVNAVVRNSSVQKMFKDNLINEYGCKCMICGIGKEEVILASHIKPSAESDVYEKINNNNGLLLCANHDKLFDNYLITFDYLTGKIKISDFISKQDREKLGINSENTLEKSLMTPERKKFLKEHNNIFKNLNG